VPVVHPARMLGLILTAVIAVFVTMRATQAQPPARKLPWS
jgi:hypothetical protein